MSDSCPFPPGASIVAYLRDSGGDDQDLSTAQQQERIETWCADNKVILSKIYTDAARQGSSVEARDSFLEMIDHFRDPNCRDKGIIIWTLSRFARNQDDAQYYKADLRRRGYIIHSMNDNIPNTTDGKVFEAMIDWMNAKYLEDLSRDIKRGLQHNLKEFGAISGRPPVGFMLKEKVIGIRRDGSPHKVSCWVPNPDLTPLVISAFKMRADGYGIQQIHDKLQLYKSRSCYSTFFRNRLYIGELIFGSTVVKDYCEPLIPINIWNKVQELNYQNRPETRKIGRRKAQDHPKRATSEFLLSGLLYCQKCGSIMNGHVVHFGGKKRNDYYICTGKKARMACDALSLPKQYIEDIVIQKLTDYIQDPEILTNREQDRALLSASKSAELKASIKLKQKDLHDNRRRLNNLVDKIADEPNAPASILERIRMLEQEVHRLEHEIDLLESQAATTQVHMRTPAEVHDLSNKLLDLLTSEDIAEKHAILKLFVYRVTAERYDDRIIGQAFFRDELIQEDAPPGIKKLMPI
jgi:site-specific DNA recombinase